MARVVQEGEDTSMMIVTTRRAEMRNENIGDVVAVNAVEIRSDNALPVRDPTRLSCTSSLVAWAYNEHRSLLKFGDVWRISPMHSMANTRVNHLKISMLIVIGGLNADNCSLTLVIEEEHLRDFCHHERLQPVYHRRLHHYPRHPLYRSVWWSSRFQGP